MLRLKKHAEKPTLTITVDEAKDVPSDVFNLLTPKQARFIDEFLIDLNGTQAAIRAGYSKKTAQQIATENLSKPVIQAEIRRRQDELAEKCGITAEKIVSELGKLGFSNMGDYLKCNKDGDPYFDYEPLTPEQKAALAEVVVETYVEGKGKDAQTVKKVKFKLADKISALEKLGRHLGMFKDREPAGSSAGGVDRELLREFARLYMARQVKVIDVE
jgi:phage terminase small subunit